MKETNIFAKPPFIFTRFAVFTWFTNFTRFKSFICFYYKFQTWEREWALKVVHIFLFLPVPTDITNTGLLDPLLKQDKNPLPYSPSNQNVNLNMICSFHGFDAFRRRESRSLFWRNAQNVWVLTCFPDEQAIIGCVREESHGGPGGTIRVGWAKCTHWKASTPHTFRRCPKENSRVGWLGQCTLYGGHTRM